MKIKDKVNKKKKHFTSLYYSININNNSNDNNNKV